MLQAKCFSCDNTFKTVDGSKPENCPKCGSDMIAYSEESLASEVLDRAIQEILRYADGEVPIIQLHPTKLDALADAVMLGLVEKDGGIMKITNAGRQAQVDIGKVSDDFFGVTNRSDIIGNPVWGESKANEMGDVLIDDTPYGLMNPRTDEYGDWTSLYGTSYTDGNRTIVDVPDDNEKYFTDILKDEGYDWIGGDKQYYGFKDFEKGGSDYNPSKEIPWNEDEYEAKYGQDRSIASNRFRRGESKASEDDGDKYNRDLDEIRDKAYDYVENNLSKFNLTEKDVDDWHNGNGFNGRYENTVNRVIDDMTYRLEKPLYESKASLKAMKASGAGDMIDDIPDGMDLDEWLNESKTTEQYEEGKTVCDYCDNDVGVDQKHDGNDICKYCVKEKAWQNESLASEDDPDYDNDADFEGKINGASVEPSQYTQSGMDHTDYGRGDIDESKSNEAGSEDHMCAECGFITSDNSEYIDHLNSHEE